MGPPVNLSNAVKKGTTGSLLSLFRQKISEAPYNDFTLGICLAVLMLNEWKDIERIDLCCSL